MARSACLPIGEPRAPQKNQPHRPRQTQFENNVLKQTQSSGNSAGTKLLHSAVRGSFCFAAAESRRVSGSRRPAFHSHAQEAAT
jgi:hypothetical protein